MIAKHIAMHSLAKSSFAGLVNYITDAQSKEHRLGDVRITNGANEYTQDLELAVMEVTATQQLNTRAKSDKTFHLLVSFRPDEQPSPEVLKAIEAKLCEGLGFAEHQRISAVHHDTDNLHIHIAINKIHPERLTIHEPYYPYKTLAKLCTQLEQEYGLAIDNHEPKRTVSEGKALDMEHHSGIESLTGWIQRECLDAIKKAESWQDLHQVLKENGLECRKQGNGLVFKALQSDVTVKASTVHRSLSKGALEKRLGEFEAPVVSITANEKTVQATTQHETIQKQYAKKPIKSRVDTTALYAKYQADQKRRAAHQKTTLEQLRIEKLRRIEAEKNAARQRRTLIKVMTKGRFTKQMLYGQASSALLGNLQAINNDYRAACQAVYAETKRGTWVDWLQMQAKAGDAQALAALRARKSHSLQRDTLRAVPADTQNSTKNSTKQKPAQTTQAEHEQPKRPAQTPGQPAVDQVTKKGTVIYRDFGLRDDGKAIQAPPNAPLKAIKAALALVQQKMGNCLAVAGNVLFQAKAILAAVDSPSAPVFADAHLESKRQQRVEQATKEAMHEQQRGTGRAGRTGRGAGRAFEREDNREDSRRSTGGSGTRDAAERNASNGGAKTPPPPVARDRMRDGLSKRALAGLKTGIELLLPPIVPVLVQEPRTDADAELRRQRDRETFAELVLKPNQAYRDRLAGKAPQRPEQGQTKDWSR